MKILITLNDPPYGTERSYNGLRLANSLAKQEDVELKLFLIGDAASCAKKSQKVLRGYYNIEIMINGVARRGGEIGVCGTCMDARGIEDGELNEGAKRSTLDELTKWNLWADKIIAF